MTVEITVSKRPPRCIEASVVFGARFIRMKNVPWIRKCLKIWNLGFHQWKAKFITSIVLPHCLTNTHYRCNYYDISEFLAYIKYAPETKV